MDQKVSSEIKGFVEKVNKRFKPEKIILFGSRAKGDYLEYSDYDFIIVSSKFSNMHWLTRISKIVKLWDPIKDIDVLPYTPEEFEHKQKNSDVVQTAVKEGIAC